MAYSFHVKDMSIGRTISCQTLCAERKVIKSSQVYQDKFMAVEVCGFSMIAHSCNSFGRWPWTSSASWKSFTTVYSLVRLPGSMHTIMDENILQFFEKARILVTGIGRQPAQLMFSQVTGQLQTVITDKEYDALIPEI